MKVLQVIDTLDLGGAERMCVNIANLLHENAIEVFVCTTRANGSLSLYLNQDIKLFDLGKKSFFDVKSFYRFYRFIKMNRINIIHSHSTSIYWAVILKLFIPKIKLIWHDHEGEKNEINSLKRKLLLKFSFLIDFIIVVNEFLFSWASSMVDNYKIVVLNNFSSVNSRINDSTNSDYFKIIHVANLRPQKDHFNLINAVYYFNNEYHQKIKVLCIGIDMHDEYSLEIKKLIVDKKLEAVIEFKGPVKDISNYLSEAHIGILTSYSEGLPMVLLEYGVYGIPIITTNVGDCHKVLNNEKFGLLVKPNEPILFAKALNNLIVDYQCYKEKRAEFIEYVDLNFGSRKFFIDYMKILNNLE